MFKLLCGHGAHFRWYGRVLPGIRGATINSNGSTLPTVALRIDAPGTYSDIHIESAVSSIVVGSQTGTSAVFISNIGCGPSITDCVKISNAFSNQNLSLYAINSTTGNIITDQILRNTLTVAGEGGQVAMYVTGNSSPPSLLAALCTRWGCAEGELKETTFWGP